MFQSHITGQSVSQDPGHIVAKEPIVTSITKKLRLLTRPGKIYTNNSW